MTTIHCDIPAEEESAIISSKLASLCHPSPPARAGPSVPCSALRRSAGKTNYAGAMPLLKYRCHARAEDITTNLDPIHRPSSSARELFVSPAEGPPLCANRRRPAAERANGRGSRADACRTPGRHV